MHKQVKERISIEFGSTKIKVITIASQNKGKYHKELIRIQSKTSNMKRGKTLGTTQVANGSGFLIGREGGATFLDQSVTIAKQNHCNPELFSTLD